MTRPPLWRRLIGFNALTAVVLGVGGYYLGWFLGHQITGPSVDYFANVDFNELSLVLAYTLGVLLSSWVRISMALRPPMKKKRPMPTRYWMPTTLWSVQRPK